MSASSILLGAVLTFGSAEGAELQLTVSLSRTATASLVWGETVRTSSVPSMRHHFAHLPAPLASDIAYALRIASEAPFQRTVKALTGSEPLRVGLYGDSRGGEGPHAVLVEAMTEADPHVVIHTGDVVQTALDEEGWISHLATTLPFAAHVPMIFAIGNHELWQPQDLPRERRVDALGRALAQIPPPKDSIASRIGAPKAAFHVRIGDLVVISLDSNVGSFAPDTSQYRLVEAVLEEHHKGNVSVFAAMHHGPWSSGRHGGHPGSGDLARLFESRGVTAVMAGHDHTYERIVRAKTTYVISGGGGAPLYQRSGYVPGSLAFASTYNWVLLTREGRRWRLRAYSLEGVLLDEGLFPPQEVQPAHEPRTPWAFVAALALLFGAFLFAIYRLGRR